MSSRIGRWAILRTFWVGFFVSLLEIVNGHEIQIKYVVAKYPKGRKLQHAGTPGYEAPWTLKGTHELRVTRGTLSSRSVCHPIGSVCRPLASVCRPMAVTS